MAAKVEVVLTEGRPFPPTLSVTAGHYTHHAPNNDYGLAQPSEITTPWLNVTSGGPVSGRSMNGVCTDPRPGGYHCSVTISAPSVRVTQNRYQRSASRYGHCAAISGQYAGSSGSGH